MISLFNIPNYVIDTSKFSHYLHGDIVKKFEQNFCDYVGAKYGCTFSSATNAIFLTFLNKHITVNGNNCNIPSYSLKVGDQVSVRERSKSLETISASLAQYTNQMEWLEFNADTKSGKIISIPERIQIPENIKEQLIVELYSK